MKMLSDLKVVEFGEFISAPFCTKMMSDWGAEVIKIETPNSGDMSRHHGPFPGDLQDPEKSGLYLYLNTNKKGITLNVKEPEGRAILEDLLKEADIFVENNPPSLMKDLGLDYGSLKHDFPHLIMTSITPFGQTGPYGDWKGQSLNVAAMSGVAAITGNPVREPLDHPMSFCDFQGAIAGAIASMAAVFVRDNTGKGQLCDIDISHVMMSYQGTGVIAMYKKTNEVGMRSGAHSTTIMYPWGIFPCKDGYFGMNTLIYEHWEKFMQELGNPDWLRNPKFNPPDKTVFSLGPHYNELDDFLIPELKKYTKQELADFSQKANAPFYPAMTLKDMAQGPQTQYRNEIVEIDHPKAGALKYPGAPAVLSETPWALDSPAPLLGQHNEEIYCDIMGYTKHELSRLMKQGVI